jgi:hypothetical protein
MDTDVVHNRMGQFFEALRALRICWVVTLVSVVLLALPPQVRDLYRTLAENSRVDAASPKIVLTALLLLLAAFLTYFVGRHRARVHLSALDTSQPVLATCLRWGPPICGALLIVGAAGGMLLSRLDVLEIPTGINKDMDSVILDMKSTADHLGIAALAAGIVALVFLFATRAWSSRADAGDWSPRDYAFDWPERLLWAIAVVALIALAFVPEMSVPLSQSVGSLAIFLAFITLLLMGLSMLQTWSDRHGVPWILLLVLWGGLLAVLDLHKPRINLRERPEIVLTQVQDRFLDWYDARQDKSAFADQPYPVFLISAEAGGLYAAQFAAKVLARIQDRCPSFAQHVFMISGVSGGSLGAAIFSSLVKESARNTSWQPCKLDSEDSGPSSFEAKVNTILNKDFLAPIVSRALFADLVQHFVPTRMPGIVSAYLPPAWSMLPDSYQYFLSQFSRGRAFEETIEQAWTSRQDAAREASSNAFSQPFLEQWKPEGANPALMLNTTSVNDGRQVFIAPFGAGGGLSGYESGLLYFQPVFPPDKDMSLAAAVSLSGRFPWILPASTVGSDQFAVVDGAYFESSGIETLALVRGALRPYEVKPNGKPDYPYVRVYVIVIGSFTPPVDTSTLVLDEATPPVRTLLNARDRRGYNAFNILRSWDRDVECPPQRPEAQLESQAICHVNGPVVFRLNYDHFNLPLGWTLSEGVVRIIDQHARGRCLDDPNAELTQSDPRKILQDNKMSAEYFVPNFLSPKPSVGQEPTIKPPC